MTPGNFSEFSEKLSAPVRYALAVALILCAALLGSTILPRDVGAHFVTFYPAIMVAFYLAGNGPGVVAIILSAALSAYHFSSPYHSISSTPEILLSVGSFVVSAAACAYFVKSLLKTERRLARAQLERTSQSLSLALDGGKLGVWRYRPSDRSVSLSDTCARHYGLPEGERLLTYDRLLSIIPPEEKERARNDLGRAIVDRTDFVFEHRMVWPDGSEHWIYVHGRPLVAADGGLEQLDGVTMDITERVVAEANYRSSAAIIKAAFASMDEGIIIADTQGNVINMNWGVAPFCRITDPALVPKTFAEFAELLNIFTPQGEQLTEETHPYSLGLRGVKGTYELKFQRRDTGETWYGLVGSAPILDAQDRVTGVVITGQEITGRVQAKERLEAEVALRTAELTAANEALLELSRHDILTGLHNRLASNERLGSEFARMKRSGQAYALLALDIDYFKSVNDNYGHAIGDEVLKDVARILSENLRESDFAARWGGEEFLILLPHANLEQACLVVEKLRSAVEAAPHPTAGKITISIGVAVAAPNDPDVDYAAMKADEGLYKAKENGRNRVVAASSFVRPARYLFGT